ncbi:hypothetical protein [Pseudomonas fluorescens]|uniref:Uncharacterized protein n=1 Tax=Pseudomonas fluorescens TaxID=294 RepID=A0A0F4SZX0_PSEFL|nr:hypothetical protein [Pseudomonas fluorescens]KJZ37691.1 hypothetical protein VC35_26295 [Pseudomonas fluorescens]
MHAYNVHGAREVIEKNEEFIKMTLAVQRRPSDAIGLKLPLGSELSDVHRDRFNSNDTVIGTLEVLSYAQNAVIAF